MRLCHRILQPTRTQLEGKCYNVILRYILPTKTQIRGKCYSVFGNEIVIYVTSYPLLTMPLYLSNLSLTS